MATRPIYVHIGASKTGTSALQAGLNGAVGQLADQGVGLPLVGRQENVAALLRPLGWVTASGFTKPVRPARLAALTARLRAADGARLLLTNEDLCELEGARLSAFVQALREADLEPHVVLTVRHLAAVVPSEWQQFLKHRLTLDYPTFLRRLRERRGRWARHFWLRQDVAALAHRWAAAVGPDHLHVVVTPDRRTDPEGLYRTFGEVVGFDHRAIPWPERDVNASWGLTEAEVYRRLNAALGERLPGYERDYQPAVRWPLVTGVLPRGASARITLPPEHLDWVLGAAQGHVAALEELAGQGVHVHGDLARLLPGPEDAAPVTMPDESEVARAAVDALATFAVSAHHKARRRPRRAQRAEGWLDQLGGGLRRGLRRSR